jgi:hypothetical protein
VCCPVRVKALINSVASRIALGYAVLGIFSRTDKLLKVLQLLLLQGYGCIVGKFSKGETIKFRVKKKASCTVVPIKLSKTLTVDRLGSL